MNGGPIGTYLDNLFVELRRSSPRDARTLLNEAEATYETRPTTGFGLA